MPSWLGCEFVAQIEHISVLDFCRHLMSTKIKYMHYCSKVLILYPQSF